MSFQNSTMTLEDLKSNLSFNIDDSTNIENRTVVDAYNKAISIYQRLEREAFPSRGRSKTGALSVSSSGYDLSLITDLGSQTNGFYVYRDAINDRNRLFETSIGSRDYGYYILGDGKLYLTPDNTSATIYIVYAVKTDRQSVSLSDLSTVTLAIDQDLEETFEAYVESRFYKREHQLGLMDEAKDNYIQELTRYFRRPARASIL